jgi:RND family efflux transporter MFP subunit
MSETGTGTTVKRASYILGIVVMALLMLYMGGVFTTGKAPLENKETPALPQSGAGPEVKAEKRLVTEYYEAVGTIRPRTETTIEAQVTGRILAVKVKTGDPVREGDPLIVLDSREMQTRLEQAQEGYSSAESRVEQARQAVAAAEAVYAQAGQAYSRAQKLFKSEAATKQDLEQAEAAYKQAEANLKRARDGFTEAKSAMSQAGKAIEQGEIGVGYSEIKAPKDGEVVKRLVEPGELAFPGKPLLTLQTRGALRIEAVIRESLINQVGLGARLRVRVGALNKDYEGQVEEVIPSADPATRTFLVKAGLPESQGLFPGMFGRLLVPVSEREAVAVPREAVARVGQLEMVLVKAREGYEKVYVRTGRMVSDRLVEVLSGLSGDEVLAARPDEGA